MIYRVDYLVRERATSSDEVASFEAAKLLAVNAVEMGTAESAEVRGTSGELMFRHPRTVRNA